MKSLAFNSSPSLSLKPRFLPSLFTNRFNQLKKLSQKKKKKKKRSKNGGCRAELSTDAPVAFAIGACILNSLAFPVTLDEKDAESNSLIDTDDTRFAVMGIVSFIPYFNWMSWVFAWMATGKRRYAVYAIVYLAPYLRSNLSISPEESWLPIVSILLCIGHIQLEASINRGDVRGFQVFNEAAKRLSSFTRKKNHEGEARDVRKDYYDLPSAQERYRQEIRDWAAHQESDHEDEEIIAADDEDRGKKKH